MLIDLYIKNFAIIEELHLEFWPKLTVISGETGAGKSITVDALSAVLGGRCSAEMIYQEREQGEVIATFDVTQFPPAKRWLKENALESEDHLAILRRVISKNGRSRGFINGRAMPLHALKAFGELLIDIHGQHAHQSLMKPSHQRKLVDLYSDSEADFIALTEIAQTIKMLEERLEALMNQDDHAQERINFLKFQLAEFEAVAPKENEWSEISERFHYLSNHEERLTTVEEALTTLSDENHGITKQINYLLNSIADFAKRDEDFNNLHEMLSNALILCNESENELQRHLDVENFDEEELQHLDHRMRELNSLAHKHRIEPEMLLQKQADLEAELSDTEVTDDLLLDLKEEIKRYGKKWQQLADKITEKRKRGIKSLNRKITASMQDLAMEGGIFEIRLTANPPYHAHGNESIEYFVTANPGQPLMPLNRVASGGELARISLAIAVIISLKSTLPVLVFDEVDTGVGGAVAEMIGKHLQDLSDGRQVICVTHLPQVASFGHNHLYVHKQKEKNQTTTAIKMLNEEERIKEIARMLGGVTLTDATYQHAREMLKSAGQS